jgi:hypothetical protein
MTPFGLNVVEATDDFVSLILMAHDDIFSWHGNAWDSMVR